MKLLIVDDDKLICSSLARSLIRLGHAARAATSVESACRLIEVLDRHLLACELDVCAGCGQGAREVLRRPA